MYISNCKHCNSSNLYLHQKGPNLGLYCGDCGKWITWVGKKDRREYEVYKVPLSPVLRQPAKPVQQVSNGSVSPQFRSVGISGLSAPENGSQAQFRPPSMFDNPTLAEASAGVDLPFDPDDSPRVFANQVPAALANQVPIAPVNQVPAMEVSEIPVVKNGAFDFKPAFGLMSNAPKKELKAERCEKCKSNSALVLTTSLGNLYMVDGVLVAETADRSSNISILDYCPYCGSPFDR